MFEISLDKPKFVRLRYAGIQQSVKVLTKKRA